MAIPATPTCDNVCAYLWASLTSDGFAYLSRGLEDGLSGEVSAIISPSRRSARLGISRLSSLAGHRQPC